MRLNGRSEVNVEALLHRARWAPSGDNAQPWRFRITAANTVEVSADDTADEVIYDYKGEASMLAAGALLETFRLAALAVGHEMHETPREGSGSRVARELQFAPADKEHDPLADVIESRVTNRRAFSSRRLAVEHVTALEEALPTGYGLVLRHTWVDRWRIARMLWRNAGIRLTTPEVFTVHRDVVDWGVKESVDRIPAPAVGLDPVLLRMMRWAMTSWRRVDVLNRYFGGTVLPRLELDLLPGLLCGAHFVLTAPRPPETDQDLLDAGAAMQRLWLQAAALDIQFQATYSPLVFRKYVRASTPFTCAARPWEAAQRLADELDGEYGAETLDRAVFMGRLGYGQSPSARSVRLPLEKLLRS